MQTATVDARLGDITLHGVRAGRGPMVLMFHGITGNGYVYLPLMERLAHSLTDSFTCVSFDQRGHGRSSKPAAGYGANDFASDIAALVRHFGAGPALVVGHSLGARNGLVCAARHPDLVRGVVAIDFTPYIETAVFDALDARVAGGDQVFPDMDAARAYLANRYPNLPRRAIELRAHYGMVACAGGYRPLADARSVAATSSGLRDDLEAPLRALKVPAVLVRGAESKLVSKDAWARTLALRPDLPARELPGVDHYVQEEDPDAVASIVRDFARTLSN